ncbi:dihydrodipicolinate reductase [Enterococcus sp. 10A9_DIV0425]|uniref:4-hydroxy-tetrahydrodipicolinate reductase n=1 Tax=Candidatus Enterococcus wittei TaxID=1987383 RepID=A0A242K1Z4_9ENTE|nr:4-hydroxy-tetrahydrodipicolinate reductase [Enterococcus sp. 10A9_DIV0425]OTP11294.1 dihydrodipicolinate reductase [Enterococcus sp. 10A9_DIV0425]THE11421.1 4-hydroxy-tetrahydrodipicolinate reductase [Enterococcus hirae]
MNIGIIGNGKMGQRIAEIVKEQGDSPLQVIHSLRGLQSIDFAESPEILIDFSHPDNLEKVLAYSQETHVPLVSGTTGYSQAQLAHLKKAAQTIPVLYSANFSLGIMVMNRLIKQAAMDLASWQIEVMEKHHDQKKDAPSGTAKYLVETLQSVQNLTPVYQWTDKERQANEIGVHSIRAGSFPGEHEVLFAGNDEVLSIKHEAFSNRIFAQGAIQASYWLKEQPPGFYHLEDLFAPKGGKQ